MKRDCEQWAFLADRVAIGEEVPQEDHTFLRGHAGHCDLCGSEAQVWAVLENLLARPEQLQDALLLGPPSEAVSERRRFAWLRRRFDGRSSHRQVGAGRWVAGVGAVALAAAGGLFVLAERPTSELKLVGPEPVPTDLVLTSGDVELRGSEKTVAGAHLGSGDRLRVGSGAACLQWKASRVCVGEHTELAIESSTDQQHVISLRSGMLVAQVEKQPSQNRFVVRTPRGDVVVKGTVFAVTVHEADNVEVRVREGAVAVRQEGQEEHLVRAARALVWGESTQERDASPALLQQDSEWMTKASSVGNGVDCRLDVESSPSRAEVSLNHMVLGATPLSAQVPCGSHELVLRLDGFLEESQTLNLSAGPLQRSIVLKRAGEEELAPSKARVLKPQPPKEAVKAAAPESAAELLTKARAYRSARRYSEAATAYRTLVKEHRSSSEAGPALVALGELELSQLSQPAAALKSFDTYLKTGGPLEPEAHYGRIRALRQLGRAAEADRATARFLRDFPNSVQAAQLRAAQTAG